MRFLLAAIILSSTGAFAQPFDAVAAGIRGGCLVIPPILQNVVDWTGGHAYADTGVYALAPGPFGRVLAAKSTSAGFVIAEIRPDATQTPLSVPVQGAVRAMVADANGAVYSLKGPTYPGSNTLVAFNADGTLRAQYQLGSWYWFDTSHESTGQTVLDLAADQCTLFLIREATVIRRFDVCSGTFLDDFAPVPGYAATSLRVLPDGGLLVAVADRHGSWLKRFNAAGTLLRSYPVEEAPNAMTLTAGGTGVLYADDNCDGARLLSMDLETGAITAGPQLRMQSVSSIVSYYSWTAAIGAAHLPEVPATKPLALVILAILSISLALLRLRE